MRFGTALIGVLAVLLLAGCDDNKISLDEVKAGLSAIDGNYRVSITEASDPLINPGFVAGYVANDQGQRVRFCVQELKRGMFKGDDERPCEPMNNSYSCAGVEILHDLGDQPASGPTSKWKRSEAMAAEIDALMKLKGADIVCMP